MSKPPNVLFILSDQHNAKVLGHKNHPDVKTPNLDRLATEGVRFDNAIVQNPICTPSRMCFLSGQYCHNHGYYGLCGHKPDGLPTLLGHVRQQGYRSAAIGKIHCPEYWVEDDSDLFLEVCGGCSIGSNPQYMRYVEKMDLLDDLERCVATRDPQGRYQCLDGFASTIPYRSTAEGWCVTQCVDFMQASVAEGRPFILHASFPKPHQVYAPAQEFWDMYDEQSLHLPPNADYEMEGKAPHLIETAKSYRDGKWTRSAPHTFEAGRLRKLRGYLGCVSQVDHAVGELLDWLDANGLADNTIVVYSSDHGDYACEHGIMEKAPGICSDAITRVPFIWRWPGACRPGTVVDEVVESVDLCNTICSLIGLPAMESCDGRDLTPLLQGKALDKDALGLTEFAWSKSLRQGSYRYVYYPKQMFAVDYPDGFGELYNLADDPWERRNLYFDLDHADKVREMERLLFDRLVTTTRPATAFANYSDRAPQRQFRHGHFINRDGKIHYGLLQHSPQINYL